jgi:hypothetical protein
MFDIIPDWFVIFVWLIILGVPFGIGLLLGALIF